jgi:hypothetical protein
MLWWSVLSSLRYCFVIVLGYCEPCPCKTEDFTSINVLGILTVPQPTDALSLSLFSDLPVHWEHDIKIRTINNPTVASELLKWKKKTHISPFQSKPKTIKLTQKGMSKAKTGWKSGLMYQWGKVRMQRESYWRKWTILIQGWGVAQW